MIAVYSFAISFLLLIALYLSGHREVKVGEKMLLGKILSRFDGYATKLLSALHLRLYRIFERANYILFVKIPEKSKVNVIRAKDSVLGHLEKQKEMIRGRKELNGNGSSSFFLRKVVEHKNGSEQGRIEESSLPE